MKAQLYLLLALWPICARCQSDTADPICPFNQVCTPQEDCFKYTDPDIEPGVVIKKGIRTINYSSIDGLKEIPCGKPDHICCDVQKNETEPCQELPGYKCIPFAECLKIRGGKVDVSIRTTDDRCFLPENVCCNVTDLPGSSMPPPPSLSSSPPPSSSPPLSSSPPPKSEKFICGIRNGTARANLAQTGKIKSEFGEWPHICAIYWMDNGQKFLCGGSLIAPGIALTAAHCVVAFRAEDLLVRCGDGNLQEAREPMDFQEQSVKSLSFHPRYNVNNLEYDFAVIQLSADFTMATNVGTICLPADPEDNQYLEKSCFASGWGKDTLEEQGIFQPTLKHVSLPLVSNRDCQDMLRQSQRLSDTFNLHQSFICAGGLKGEDTCKGDGGGPLVCPSTVLNGQYVQVGITSWGVGCGDENVPGAYAFLRSGICFIRWVANCRSGGRFRQDYIEVGVCEDYPGQERNRIQSELEEVEKALEDIDNTLTQKNILLNVRNALRVPFRRLVVGALEGPRMDPSQQFHFLLELTLDHTWTFGETQVLEKVSTFFSWSNWAKSVVFPDSHGPQMRTFCPRVRLRVKMKTSSKVKTPTNTPTSMAFEFCKEEGGPGSTGPVRGPARWSHQVKCLARVIRHFLSLRRTRRATSGGWVHDRLMESAKNP
eukprot:maker-scaffold43_size480169-snap-gene-1.16 protein:Tk12721 transcript:maker-scaffold43_size480169-snap-gene-1.16-mRNA-1 annotation:"hypothetical protein D910_11170"